jgi:PKD repeat protein
MRKFICLMLCLLLVSVTFGVAKNSKNKVKLVSSMPDKTATVLTFEVDSYNFKTVQTPEGEAVELDVPNAGRFLNKGAPALARLAASVIIPDKSKMKVNVMDTEFVEIENVLIAPSKGNLERTVNPDDVPYEYGKEYRKDAFYPGTLVEITRPHIARDFRGQTVIVNPFQYNPVTKVLRVYTRVTAEILDTGQNGENVLDRTKPPGQIDPAFRDVYSSHFINFDADAEAMLEYTPLNDPIGNMLIVSYGDFMDEMASFVSWKESIGYNVDLVDYSTIGSSSALKTYVANYYNTNGLTYLLLVGDHAQVPTSSTSAGDSDNNYGYIVGSDHYLDIFVGRFSAETAAHVTTQVDRTIYYEKDVLSSAEFFRHAIGMGSSEGPGHNGEYDYQHINLILADLAAYGYTTHECHQSGGSPALMSSLINAGSGTIFYCGHGTTTSWYTASWQYTSTDVNNLVNDNELPFVFSVACVVGNFRNYTCFCETWLRATDNGNGIPTGAVAHAGSTINQSWIPPMDAEDEFADLLVGGTKRTFGGVFANGLFKMIDINGSGGESMADTWVCFGDASVQLRTPGTPDGPGPQTPQPPVANFNADKTVVYEGDSVQFTDLSSYSPTSWSWTFAGGTPSSSPLQNPVVTYNTEGTYTVTLVATNAEGSDTETKVGYITVLKQGSCIGEITNPGFETGSTSGWTTSGSVGITTSSHTGSYAVSFSDTGSVEQVITGLCPNTTYTIYAWGVAKWNAGFYMGVKNYGGSDLTAQFTNSKAYTQNSITFTTGASNTTATIFFTKTTSKFSGYGDDFEIVKN